jgi:hypothetical protein
MKLGGWETLDMVVRYTRSVKFEDSLKVYEGAMKGWVKRVSIIV